MRDDNCSFGDIIIGIVKLFFVAVIYKLRIYFVGSCEQQKFRVHSGWILWKPHQKIAEWRSMAEASILSITDFEVEDGFKSKTKKKGNSFKNSWTLSNNRGQNQ